MRTVQGNQPFKYGGWKDLILCLGIASAIWVIEIPARIKKLMSGPRGVFQRETTGFGKLFSALEWGFFLALALTFVQLGEYALAWIFLAVSAAIALVKLTRWKTTTFIRVAVWPTSVIFFPCVAFVIGEHQGLSATFSEQTVPRSPVRPPQDWATRTPETAPTPTPIRVKPAPIVISPPKPECRDDNLSACSRQEYYQRAMPLADSIQSIGDGEKDRWSSASAKDVEKFDHNDPDYQRSHKDALNSLRVFQLLP